MSTSEVTSSPSSTAECSVPEIEKLYAEVERLFAVGPYAQDKEEKLKALVPHLMHLQQYHAVHCPQYAAIAALQSSYLEQLEQGVGAQDAVGAAAELATLEAMERALPMVHVQLFKRYLLSSVPESEVFKTMTSSGTSGQQVSRIVLDQRTAELQAKCLAHIMQDFLGTSRRRMLILDSKAVLRDPRMFSARGAGILGMLPFGRGHTYALDADYKTDVELLLEFLQTHQHEPLLLFGFTFMVWQSLYLELKPILEARGISLSLEDAVLIHAGGWKKMQQMAVDNDTFKRSLREILGPNLRVHNFYGMVEQTGSIYMECECGHLHVSNCSDLIVRDPLSHKVLEHGQCGVIETISALPLSSPSFALLTEDMGTILGEDDCPCGRKGKYFSVAGRIPKAEVRGCSDVYN